METGRTKTHLCRSCNQSRVDCWVAMLVKVTSLTLSHCRLLTGTRVIWRSHAWTSLPKPFRGRDRESKMAEEYACTQIGHKGSLNCNLAEHSNAITNSTHKNKKTLENLNLMLVWFILQKTLLYYFKKRLNSMIACLVISRFPWVCLG